MARTNARRKQRKATATAATVKRKSKTTKAKPKAPAKPKAGKTKVNVSATRKQRKAKPPKTAKLSSPTQRAIKLTEMKPRGGGPLVLPETAASKKGKTLRKILRNTPRLFIRNAEHVHINSLKQKKTKSGMPAIEAVCETLMPLGGKRTMRRKHKVHIIGIDKNDGSETRPVNKHKKVLIQCACLPGDTKVLTEEGWKTIFEIAQPLELGHYPIKYNIKGELVDGSAPFYTGMKPVYKLTLNNGTTVTGTKDHRFLEHIALGNRKTKEVWTELGDLEVGSALLTNNFDPGHVKKTTEFWEAFFIGVLQGDGTLFASGRPYLRLYGWKTILLPKLIQLGLVKGITEKESSTSVQLTHRALELCARYNFNNKRTAKLENLTQTMGYLSGLIATDGTTYANGDILIRGAKPYMEQLHWKLMEFGYTQCTFYKERDAGVETNKIGGSDTAAVSTKELYGLRISNQNNILHNLKLTKYHKRRIKRGKIHTRKAWVKVTDITYAGKQHVYDITVPGPHRFAANGVIAHNCENFVYVWEYANAHHGCSRIIYGNGETPTVTNPGLEFGMCKHIVPVAQTIISKNM